MITVKKRLSGNIHNIGREEIAEVKNLEYCV